MFNGLFGKKAAKPSQQVQATVLPQRRVLETTEEEAESGGFSTCLLLEAIRLEIVLAALMLSRTMIPHRQGRRAQTVVCLQT